MRSLIHPPIVYFCGMILSLWLTLLSSVACSKLGAEDRPPSENLRIGFSIDLTQSKAAPDPFSGAGLNHTIKKFGVFALLNGSIPYMNNVAVSRATSGSPWSYAPELYWPIEPLDFYAYAHNDPFSRPRAPTGDVEDVVGFRDVNVQSGIPRITMIVDSYPHFQIDLLLADAQKGKTKTASEVVIPFRHVMTKITFSARVKFDPGTHTSARITDIILSNVYDTGEIEMDATKEWIVNTSALKRKYWLHILDTENGNKELNDLELTTTYQTLSTPDGVLLLMPQMLPDDAEIEIRYQTTQPHTLILPLKTITPRWKKGAAIHYQIEIDN